MKFEMAMSNARADLLGMGASEAKVSDYYDGYV